MAKYEKEKATENQFSEDESLSEDGLEEGDYVFIVGSDGRMKSVIFPPEETWEYHKDLLRVFAFFGVTNPDELLEGHVIH